METKGLYSISNHRKCGSIKIENSAQRLRPNVGSRWFSIVQMLYKCFVFAGWCFIGGYQVMVGIES